MLQYELFERFMSKGWKYLSNGAFSHIYKNDAMPEWVLKRGTNDGTRTYLEWCLFKRKKGQFMRGMPEVDWLAGLGDDNYLCMMRRYHSARDLSLGWGGYKTLPYMVRLVETIREELPFLELNDMHSGNFMAMDDPARKNRIVLTDPSSSAYRPLGMQHRANELELAIQ